MRGWFERFGRHVEAPVDISLLAIWRIVFGGLLCVSVLRFFLYDWIFQLYQQPKLFFPYEGLGWVRAWSGSWMVWQFAGMGLCAVGIMVGAWYRWSVLGFLVLFTYAELIDKTTYLNHYYFVSLVCFLMLFVPLHGAYSLDALRHTSVRRESLPRWCLWLLRFQVGVVYFFAGVAKLKVDWLVYGQPLRIWLGAHTDLPLLGPWFAQSWVALAMSWGGAIFDLTVVGFLLWSRTRLWAYGAVIVFHLLTWKLFLIGIFPWVMILSAALFFPPDTPRRVYVWVRRWWTKEQAPQKGSTTSAYPSFAQTVTIMENGKTSAYPYFEQMEVGKENAKTSEGSLSAQMEVSMGNAKTSEGSSSSEMVVDPASSANQEAAMRWGWRRRLAYVAVGVYALWQMLFPLRHHLYGRDVCWTEQGYRFSWKVMLMEKTGTVTFWVSHRSSGRRWLVSPRAHLTPLQHKMMSTQPDMILSFAHWLVGDFARRGIGPVEVRAEAFASLNGRPMQRLIDPTVDLAKEPLFTWTSRPWIRSFRWHAP